MKKRFTVDGSDALERDLERTCAKVLAGICQLIPAERLQSVLLGGGYGRGEGGVLRTEAGDKPYNDLEFYICVRGHDFLNQQRYSHGLSEIAHHLTVQAGLEVELKLTSVEKLRSGPLTMFLYDLAMGHRTLFGHSEFLSEKQFRDERQIPLCEATRLLMNRCTGLLFCHERLQREQTTAEDADFIGRNHAKAQLAFGDVILTALGQYHWSCRERNQRLKKLHTEPTDSLLPFPASALPQLCCHHSIAVEFKLHPQQRAGERQSFLPLQKELSALGLQLWLWLETLRLRQPFNSCRDYSLSEVNKCPETEVARNRLINFRTFGLSSVRPGQLGRYPRERILHALPLLLWEDKTLQEPALLRRVQSQLNTGAATLPGLVNSYRTLWKQFS